MTKKQVEHCKLSIITPVYNLQEYLDRCIRSILSQAYTDFELILVDDGSMDSSPEMIDRYAASDERIKVVHKANGGVGTARNRGLEVATGEWIFFCDGDDELYPDSLEVMMAKTANPDIGLVIFGYEIFDENNQVVYAIPDRVEKVISTDEGLRLMFRPQYYRYQGYGCTKLYRRDVIQQSKLRFAENIYFNEDRLFCVQYLCAMSGSVYLTTAPLYKYYERNNSAMCSLKVQFNPKVLTEMDAYALMLRDMQAHGRSRELLMLCKKSFLSSIKKLRRLARRSKVSDPAVYERLRFAKYQEIGLRSVIILRLRKLIPRIFCQ